jgi:hypothetical protein
MRAEKNSFQKLTYAPKFKPWATAVLEGDESTFQ